MPDGEGAVGSHRIEQVTPVGTHPRMAHTALLALRPNDGIDVLHEGSRALIEANAAEAVLQISNLSRQRYTWSGTEIDGLPIGRESGECFKYHTVSHQRRTNHAFFLQVEDIHIGSVIIHLQSLLAPCMEGRDDNVRGEADISSRRRKSEIHTTTRRALDIQFAQHTVLVENGTPTLASHIHHRKIGLLHGMCVAIHTTISHQLISGKISFLKILHAALTYLQMAENLIVGLNQPITQIWVHLIFHHMPKERTILRPASRLLITCRNRNF